MESHHRERGLTDVSARTVGKVMTVSIVALVLAQVLGLFSTYVLDHNFVRGLVPLFDLDREDNVPTFFSAVLFLVGAAGFLLLSRVDESDSRSRGHWLVLAAVFAFLAADEWLAIHELLIEPVRELLGATGVFFYAWAIPYMIVVAVLVGYLLPWLLSFSSEIRRLLFLSATLYVLGAVGFEVLGALYVEWLGRDGYNPVVFDVLTTTEETLEMAGQALLVYAQARLLALQDAKWRVSFRA